MISEFYVPMPEDQIQQAFRTLSYRTGTVLDSVISVVVPVQGTVVHYDHWEDGYEIDLANPTQSSTEIWGDGNNANGVPPGFADDPAEFDYGDVVALRNNVPLPRVPSTILYDARDRLGATQAIVISRSAWATNPGSVLADATEVFSCLSWGSRFKMPIGEDTPNDNSMFEHVAMFVQAQYNGTTVEVDTDADGSSDLTFILGQGESRLINGDIMTGATVRSDKKVQIQLLTGDIGANHECRWYTIPRLDEWSEEYYAPVGTASDGDDAYVFLYNPWEETISINYETRLGGGSFSIVAGGSYRFLMPEGSGASFTSPGGEAFYGIGAAGAEPTANNVHDWGYSLVPVGNLTTTAVVGWGPGSSDLSRNGSPVWVVPSAATRIYIDHNGDHDGPLTDPVGEKYDEHVDLDALEISTIYDSDGDQTGMRVYTLDGTLFASAWGQDPAISGPGNPYLDVGTVVTSFPVPILQKSSVFVADNGIAGPSISDVYEITLRLDNRGLVAITAINIYDELPGGTEYVPNSVTRDDIAVVDNNSGTAFPIDDDGTNDGLLVPILFEKDFTVVKYRVTITAVGSHVNVARTDYLALRAIDTITIPATPSVQCVILLTDSDGNETNYDPNEDVYVTMTDADANLDGSAPDTVTVVVQNSTNGDFETITLVETGNNSGVFRNAIPLASSIVNGGGQEDGILHASPGDNLYVSYTDPLFGDSADDTAIVLVPSEIKQLYLDSDDTDNDTTGDLDRVSPAGVIPPDTSVSQTAVLQVSSGTDPVPRYASSHTFSYDSGTTGDHRILMVGISYHNEGGETVSSATYGGRSLHLVGTQQRTGGNLPDGRIYIFSLLDPPTGANNLTVNWSDALNCGAIVGAVTYSGVEQVNPTGFQSGDGGTANPSVTVAAGAGDLVFGVVAGENDSQYVNNHDSLWQEGRFYGETTGSAQSRSVAIAGNVTLSWTNDGDDWVAGAVPLSPHGSTSDIVHVNTTVGSAQSGAVYFTHNGTAGNNRLLLVGISWKSRYNGDAIGWVGARSYLGGGWTTLSRVGETTGNGQKMGIYYWLNPPSGDLEVYVSFSNNHNGAVVAASTFTGVHQTTPLGAYDSSTGDSNSASVAIASAAGDLVYDTIANEYDATLTATAGQTARWQAGRRDIRGAGATETATGASTTMSWRLSTRRRWVMGGVAIKPAIVPGSAETIVQGKLGYTGNSAGGDATATATFVQTPEFCGDFTIPPAAMISVKTYYTMITGAIGSTVTATLKHDGSTFFTDATATAGNDGNGTYLEWSAPLGTELTIPAGEAISLEVTTALPGGNSFRLEYDASSKPSLISLPTTTVISVDAVEIYNAPYPGGSLYPTPANGEVVYVRTVVSDPFGAADITGLELDINGPGSDDDISDIALDDANVVGGDSRSKIYEYVWHTGGTEGAYTISAIASEGHENTVVGVGSTNAELSYLDLGTPSTTEFTTGSNGPSTDTYTPVDETVFVRITDLDENADSAVVETIQAVITTASGDTETVILSETGPDTGVFVVGIPASNTVDGGDENGILYTPLGDLLQVDYVDDDDSSDTSFDTASVPGGKASLSVVKGLVSPADGQIVVGENAVFQVRVTNNGNTNLTSVVVKDSFPAANLAYVSAIPAPDSITAGTLSWNEVGPLAVGESVMLNITFEGVASAGPATNSVVADADSGSATASDTAPVTITNPEVTVTKTRLSPAAGTVDIGDTQSFRITVENTGDTAISTLPLEDSFGMSYLEFVSATVAPDSAGAGRLLWNDLANPGDLAPGGSIVVDVVFEVTGGQDPASNTAAVNFVVDANGDAVPSTSSTAIFSTVAASISGYVYKDEGVAGFGEDEVLENVTLRLYRPGYGPDGVPDTADDANPVAITTTGTDGRYAFPNLPTGDYEIVAEDLLGYTSVDDTEGDDTDSRIAVAVESLRAYPGNNFLDAVINASTFGTIAGQVREDVDADGNLADADPGIADVEIRLFTDPNGDGDPSDGAEIQSTRTDAAGNYRFVSVPPGNLVVVEADSPGYVSTGDTKNPNDNRVPVTLVPAGTNSGNDFIDSRALAQLGSIGNQVWLDDDNDGIRDGALEEGVAAVEVELYPATATPGVDTPYLVTATAVDGSYSFVNVPAGDYFVYFPAVNFISGNALGGARLSSPATEMTDNGEDNDDNGIQAVAGDPVVSPVVSLSAGEIENTLDFGFVRPGVVDGRVYIDNNGNGIYDYGVDAPLPNVDVTVTDAAGSVYNLTSDVYGCFSTPAMPGSASVDVDDADLPAGSALTTGSTDPTEVEVRGGSTVTDDTGYVLATGTGWIQGTLYVDVNVNGLFDSGDTPIPEVDVEITDSASGTYTITTDANGYFSRIVRPGPATVDVDEADSKFPARATLTSNAHGEGNDPSVVIVPDGGGATDNNGYVLGTIIQRIRGLVYIDANRNGKSPFLELPVPNADRGVDDATTADAADAADVPIGGVDVVVTDANGGVYTLTTNPAGFFMQEVAAGEAVVDVDEASLPASYTLTTDASGEGSDPTVVIVPVGGMAADKTGYVDNAGTVGTVDGTVYIDNNNDGVYDSAIDTPLPNVEVEITDSIGGVSLVTTDAYGHFSQSVAGGDATVEVDPNGTDLPAGATLGAVSTNPSTVTVPIDGTATNDTGYVLPAGAGLVQGIFYIDENGDGRIDAGDSLLADVNVVITRSDATKVTVVTDANGYFQAIVPAGSTVVDIDQDDPDVPGSLSLTTNAHGEGTDPTTVTVPDGGAATDNTGTVYVSTPAFGVKTSCRVPESGGVLVAWSAQVELGVLKYLVQVSVGDSWATLGSVFSRTEGVRGDSYEYIDRLALPGEPRTYRLLCVDVDGRSREHAVGSATAIAAAPAASVTRSKMPNFPDDGVSSIEELHYEVQHHATDTPAMLGNARRAEVSAGGLYATGGAPHVYNAGRELPDLGDGLVYVRPYSDPYTDTNVVWGTEEALRIIGDPGTVPAPPVQGRFGSDGYTAIVHVERDETLALNSMLPPGPNWFYGYSDRLVPGNTPVLTANVPSPASTGTAVVLVAMRSTTDKNHDLGLVVNDIPVALAAWSGKGHHLARFEFELADCPLRDGENSIQLWTSPGGGSKRLDYVEIHTPATPVLRDGSLIVEVAAAGDLAVPGATHAIDVTEFGNEAPLPIEDGVVASLQGGRTVYFTAGVGSLDWSEAKNLSAVDTALAGKQYVAVAPKAWLDALAPLVAKHEAEGLSSIAVAAEDLYDTYGGGFPTPAGLVCLGSRVQPEYLLIGAGASHDPKGLQGDLPPAGIPTGFVHVYEGTASTDDLYGNDLSIAVGRLPARTVGELANMVNKIVDFHPGRRAVMMADVDDATMSYGDFAALQAELAEKLPSVLLDANTMNGSAMRAALVGHIRGGANLVTYQGHGNNALIGDAYDILNTSHVDQIPPSAWLLSTCLTGAYTLEDGETKVLSSELLRTPGNGAVCVLASTCFGQAGSEHRIVEEAVRRIAAGGATWGETLLAVKTILWDSDTAAIYTLLGDPAMRTLNPVPGDREIIIVSPVAGGFVNGTQAPEVRFSLRGEWWRETLEILWRRGHGEWVPLREVTVDPEIFDYTIPWDPAPEDGTDYQIMIRDIPEDSRAE